MCNTKLGQHSSLEGSFEFHLRGKAPFTGKVTRVKGQTATVKMNDGSKITVNLSASARRAS